MIAKINGVQVTVLSYEQDECGRIYCTCRVASADRPLTFLADMIEVE